MIEHLHAFLAESSALDVLAQLANLGVAGIVLYWFMRKTDPRLDRIEETIHDEAKLTQESLDRVARINLLLVVASGLRAVSEPASAIEGELDRAQKDREDADLARQSKKEGK